MQFRAILLGQVLQHLTGQVKDGARSALFSPRNSTPKK